jgi:hypothetical protein
VGDNTAIEATLLVSVPVKWEYIVRRKDSSNYFHVEEEDMYLFDHEEWNPDSHANINVLGEAGWEEYAVIMEPDSSVAAPWYFIACFKRPLQEQEPEAQP